RWGYAAWDWSGGAPHVIDAAYEQWMQQLPRMVLVTDTTTGKSVIVTALEAGPAPWMGVDDQPNNQPKEGWHNPQVGTPTAYTGDVAGLSPAAVSALNDPKAGPATAGSPKSGDQLTFAWAPDQTAKPGPITLEQATNQLPSCTRATGPGNVVFISQRDP